jgi:hypothetical protein
LVAKLTIKLNEKEKMIDKKKKVRYNWIS